MHQISNKCLLLLSCVIVYFCWMMFASIVESSANLSLKTDIYPLNLSKCTKFKPVWLSCLFFPDVVCFNSRIFSQSIPEHWNLVIESTNFDAVFNRHNTTYSLIFLVLILFCDESSSTSDSRKTSRQIWLSFPPHVLWLTQLC